MLGSFLRIIKYKLYLPVSTIEKINLTKIIFHLQSTFFQQPYLFILLPCSFVKIIFIHCHSNSFFRRIAALPPGSRFGIVNLSERSDVNPLYFPIFGSSLLKLEERKFPRSSSFPIGLPTKEIKTSLLVYTLNTK